MHTATDHESAETKAKAFNMFCGNSRKLEQGKQWKYM